MVQPSKQLGKYFLKIYVKFFFETAQTIFIFILFCHSRSKNTNKEINKKVGNISRPYLGWIWGDILIFEGTSFGWKFECCSTFQNLIGFPFFENDTFVFDIKSHKIINSHPIKSLIVVKTLLFFTLQVQQAKKFIRKTCIDVDTSLFSHQTHRCIINRIQWWAHENREIKAENSIYCFVTKIEILLF